MQYCKLLTFQLGTQVLIAFGEKNRFNTIFFTKLRTAIQISLFFDKTEKKIYKLKNYYPYKTIKLYKKKKKNSIIVFFFFNYKTLSITKSIEIIYSRYYLFSMLKLKKIKYLCIIYILASCYPMKNNTWQVY